MTRAGRNLLGMLGAAGLALAAAGCGREEAVEVPPSAADPLEGRSKVEVPVGAIAPAPDAEPLGKARLAASEVEVRTKLSRAREMKPIDTALTPEQLRRTGATGSHAYEVAGTPLRVIVLDYPDARAAADAIVDVMNWANGSGLVHHAEASGSRSRVILVGTATEDPLPEEMKGEVDKVMNAFIER